MAGEGPARAGTVRRLGVALALALALALVGTSGPIAAASLPPLRVAGGVVASGHEAASRAGAEILAEGGDAADAAIAVMATLGVVTPMSSGLGGGCFMLLHRASEGRTLVLDAREVAPRAASRDMFLRNGVPDPESSRTGGLAVAVPGEVAGMAELHRRFGRLPWARLFRAAAGHARDGVTVHRFFERISDDMAERLARAPGLAALYAPGGRLLARGQSWRNPELADTLETLAARGADWFYRGELGQELVAAVKAEGGVLSASDLAGYRVRERVPVEGSFHGHRIVSMPPPSSGGAVLVEILQTLDRFDLAGLGRNSSAYLHLLAEAMKHAFSDRARDMGDPDFYPVPLSRLVSPEYAARLARAIRPHRVSPDDRYGFAGLGGEGGKPVPGPEDGGTNHLTVVDRHGNVAAVTTTINYTFGSLVTVPGRGLVLNNQMDDFAIAPGVPNAFGLVGGEANAVAPGKVPLSSMSPTLVFRDGSPVLALGAAGGPRIITATLQTILNVLVFGRDVQQALDAPRVHHQWQPPVLKVEDDLPRDVIRGLEARGHRIELVPVVGGRVEAVAIGPGWREAASDPRGEGCPAGH